MALTALSLFLVDEDDDFLEASGPALPAVAAADFFLSSQTAALRV